MSIRSNILAAGAAGLLFMALPALAKTAQKVKPRTMLAEPALIENTGSTNTTGYRITLYSTGGARMDGKALGLPIAMNKQFFRDLAAAMPLTSLTVRHGMRSASFGTQTYITYKGQRSPDLSFGGDERANAIKADIEAITKALHVGNAPRRLLMPVDPPPDKN